LFIDSEKERTMDPDSNVLGRIITLIALIALSAAFAMCESAIVTLNDTKLRKMAEGGNKKAIALTKLVEHPSRFFATIQLGAALSGFFAAALAVVLLVRRLAEALAVLPVPEAAVGAASFIVVVLLTVLAVLTLGEFVLKRVGVRHHEKISMALARPLAAFAWMARPLVALLSFLSGGILRLLGIDPNVMDEPVTEEEIRMLLDEGSEDGNIEESDKDMIINIFDFDDTTVDELMTHRTDIVSLELGATLRQVVGTAVESHYTRFPVCEGDLDNIVGILHVKDLLERIISPDAPFDISSYLREPFYAAESMSCKLLLSILKEKKQQMAVVVDEYGGTAGIITMEDLLESIVGNIQDEYDDEEEEISSDGAGVYSIDGIADLEEVCKALGLELGEDDLEEFETISGYIIDRLGYIPDEHERPELRVGDVLFTVEAVEDRRIAKLKAERISQDEIQSAQEQPAEQT